MDESSIKDFLTITPLLKVEVNPKLVSLTSGRSRSLWEFVLNFFGQKWHPWQKKYAWNFYARWNKWNWQIGCSDLYRDLCWHLLQKGHFCYCSPLLSGKVIIYKWFSYTLNTDLVLPHLQATGQLKNVSGCSIYNVSWLYYQQPVHGGRMHREWVWLTVNRLIDWSTFNRLLTEQDFGQCVHVCIGDAYRVA